VTADEATPDPGDDRSANTGDETDMRGLVEPFPTPGELLAAVLTEWELIDDGQQPYNLDLPRPWDPATCTDPRLRTELWEWLDQFASWVNQQCLWDPSDLLPPCWPHHPHLVHELAVLAVQRRQATRTPTAWALEQWQTHTLPTFLTRTHSRIRRHCNSDHQPTPATPAHTRHQTLPETIDRQACFKADLATETQSR
jgi:hypothetical protein